MVNIMRKITTILVILALVASALPLYMNVDADAGTDVFIQALSISALAPNLPGNITFTALIRSADLPCSNLQAIFSYRNGTDQPVLLMSTLVPGPVVSTVATTVQGYWNSSLVTPDIHKYYNISLTLLMTGDTNVSNNTKYAVDQVNWKAPEMTVLNMTGASKAYKGDDYPLTLIVANFGNADFHSIVDIPIFNGGDIVASTRINCTVGCSLPVGSSMPVVATIPKDKTLNFTAGIVHLMTGLKVINISFDVTFKDKVSNVSVVWIKFDPVSDHVKATHNVTIQAKLQNLGNKDAVDMPVFFAYNGTVIMECPNNINITAGATNLSTCVWRIPTSDITMTYTINVTPDPYNATVKGYLEAQLVVLPAPHFILGISDMTFDPTTLVVKENVGDTQDLTVKVTVNNTGDLDLVNGVLKLDTGQGPILINSSVNISAGGHAVVTFKFPVSTPENDTPIKITATIMKGAMSFYFSKNITVPGDVDRPDYDIWQLTVLPATESERGLWIEINAIIKNVGDATGVSIPLTFRAGTTELGIKTVASLPAGTSANVAVAWSIPQSQALGNIDLNVSIVGTAVHRNLTYKIIEFKTPKIALEFGKDKDGKVQSFSGSAASGQSKTYTITVLLTNIGDADAKNLTLLLKDSKGNVLGSMSQVGVRSGKNVTVTFTIKFKAGTNTKLSAVATYDGLHGIAGLDKDLTSASVPAESPTVKVSKKTAPGFEAVLLVGALAAALVVLSRRKKT